jgi:hypothetical protein
VKLIRATAALALGLSLLVPGHTQDIFTPHGCAAADKNCQRAVMRAHKTHKVDSYGADLAQPVIERIHAAPSFLVEYLNMDNVLNGYPERPRAPMLDAAFRKDMEDAVRELPPQVLRVIGRKLVGIYLVEDLGGTGFTDMVTDAGGQPVAGFIVLDAAVLARHTANAWATWKENTPFKPDAAWQLQARIEDGAADNRKNAIQYILLHELGHVLAIGSDIHPPWWIDPKEVPAGADFPFFNLSWTLDRETNKISPLAAHDFEQRKSTAYYFGAKLDGAAMQPTYEALERTGFASLYGSTSFGDDFAEAFASYVHVVLMGRPWEITLWRDGQRVKTVAACWGQPRCAGKNDYLEKMLGAK